MSELKSRKLLQAIIGLFGITLVIIIHELGHFIACKFYNVSTPIFSVGFGPSLLQIPIKSTIFQLSLLPLGGYVSINSAELELQPYVHIFVIMIAGILFNIISALITLWYLQLTKKSDTDQTQEHAQKIKDFMKDYQGFIGPIGIIQLVGASLFFGHRFFLFILAVLSLNIAFFNILPIPFLDGGQILTITLSRIFGEYADTAYTVILIIMTLIIAAMLINKKRNYSH